MLDQSGAPAAGSSTWTWSTNVASVDVTGLGSWNELLIIARNVTLTSSGNRQIWASTDNGSTFFTTSGNYVVVDNTNGTETNQNSFGFHSTATTAARTMIAEVKNLKGPLPYCLSNNSAPRILVVANTNPVNAIRFAGSAGNLSGGSLYVPAR